MRCGSGLIFALAYESGSGWVEAIAVRGGTTTEKSSIRRDRGAVLKARGLDELDVGTRLPGGGDVGTGVLDRHTLVVGAVHKQRSRLQRQALDR